MASQKQLVILRNKETGETYYTRKNKKLVERKLKYKKYSQKLRKNIWFEEIKKLTKLKKNKPAEAQKKKESKVEKTEKKTKVEAENQPKADQPGAGKEVKVAPTPPKKGVGVSTVSVGKT